MPIGIESNPLTLPANTYETWKTKKSTELKMIRDLNVF